MEVAPVHEPQPRLVSVPTAAAYCGVSVPHMKRLLSAHRIGSCLIGRRRLVDIAELDAFIDDQLAQAS